jgi:hypothetical protein
MEAIYEINQADASKGAFAWFNVLAESKGLPSLIYQ